MRELSQLSNSRCRFEVQVAIMSRPITSYFATISQEELLTQATARPPRALPAIPPQPKKRPVGRPRKISTINELETCDHGTPRHSQKRSADDSQQENSSSLANKSNTKQVRCQYSYKQKESGRICQTSWNKSCCQKVQHCTKERSTLVQGA